MKLRRFLPLPVIQQRGPRDPVVIKVLRLMGLRCMGPYANDRWYIFLPKGHRTVSTTARAKARLNQTQAGIYR